MEIKKYLGDVKWVLYQYVCDLNANKIYFRCGKFAYEKIKTIGKIISENPDTDRFALNLNGEYIFVQLLDDLDRKQIIITPIYDCDMNSGRDYQLEYNYSTFVYPKDIILYFA